jgi:hypothetical protein
MVDRAQGAKLYKIESATRVGKEFLDVTLSGDTTYEMVHALFIDLDERARNKQLHVLIDETELHPALFGFRELKDIVGVWRKVDALRTARIAVIAPGPVMYGLNRMFSLLANDESIHVFMWREDAIAWLLQGT